MVVRINDRGPFVRGVSLDLARGAAFALGMRGNATVRIAQVGGESAPYAPDQGGFSQEEAAASRAQVAPSEWRADANDTAPHDAGPQDAKRFWGSPFEHGLD